MPDKPQQSQKPQHEKPKLYRMLENIRYGSYYEFGSEHDLAAAGIPQASIEEWIERNYIEVA